MLRLNFLALCFAGLVSTGKAFMVAPAVDLPVAVTETKIVSVPTMANVQTSYSNLPSQLDLFDKVGSLTLAEAPKSSNVASGSGINIADIHYDGIVPKTEADEYVVISNSARDPVDVSGYYIYVASTGTQGPTFYFPKGSVIKGGASVRIYTNEIHKETGGYSYGYGKALWSNNGGLAVLKDNNGKKLGEYKYKVAK